jgi:Tfp pilus assembly protein PilZ
MGGLFIKTNVFPPINSEVIIKLYPPHSFNPIELTGRVVHIIDEEKAKKMGKEPGFGVEFLDMDEEKKSVIEAIINHFKKLETTVYGRRRCPRMPYETEVHIKMGKAIVPGKTLDISLLGAYIVVPKRDLPIGKEFEAIFFRVGNFKEVSVKIRIVHFLEDKKAKEFGKEEGYGVEFVELPQEAYIEIYKMMERWVI